MNDSEVLQAASECGLGELMKDTLGMSMRLKRFANMCIENAEKSTDAAPCVQKTAELSDDEIVEAYWEGYYSRNGGSRTAGIKAVIAADRKLRGEK